MNVINKIFNNFKFILNSIIIYKSGNHCRNINYNEADNLFYSYDSFHNEEGITKIKL